MGSVNYLYIQRSFVRSYLGDISFAVMPLFCLYNNQHKGPSMCTCRSVMCDFCTVYSEGPQKWCVGWVGVVRLAG